MSSTCFEHPSVHHQEDLYKQFYGIPVMHQYKEAGRRQDGHPAVDQLAYIDA
jgi:hypothetical protein